MWIELTEAQTNSRVMVNFDYVESFTKSGGETLIVFSSSNYLVKESYEKVQKKTYDSINSPMR